MKLSNNLWLEIEPATLKTQPAITLRPSPDLLLLDDGLNMSRAISNRAASKTASRYPPDMSHGVAVFSFSCLDKSHYSALPYISAQTEMNSRPVRIYIFFFLIKRSETKETQPSGATAHWERQSPILRRNALTEGGV